MPDPTFSEPLAQGLLAIHKIGVLHDDVEPNNILMDAAGKPWIIDFRRAKRHECPCPPEWKLRWGVVAPSYTKMGCEELRDLFGTIGAWKPSALSNSLNILFELTDLTWIPAVIRIWLEKAGNQLRDFDYKTYNRDPPALAVAI